MSIIIHAKDIESIEFNNYIYKEVKDEDGQIYEITINFKNEDRTLITLPNPCWYWKQKKADMEEERGL